jgi:hypothetical protein
MTEMKRVLIFGGKTGWIGQQMAELVKKEGTVVIAMMKTIQCGHLKQQ